MSSRKTLVLAVSLVAGLVAAFLVYSYVNGVEERAEGDQETRSVLVAKQQIARGANATTLSEDGSFALVERRKSDIPSNALDRSEDILTQVALLDIAPGTIITNSMFSAQGSGAPSNADALGEDKVAITTSVDSVRGVARLISVGDYVNITVVGKCVGNQLVIGDDGGSGGDDTGAAGDAGGGEGTDCAASLFQKAEVYAIGQNLGAPVASVEGEEEASASTGSDLITFIMPPEAAQAIAFSGPGSLYLTLVSDEYIPIELLPTFSPLPTPGVAGLTPVGEDPEKAESDQ